MEAPAEKLGLYGQNEDENISSSHMNMNANRLPSLRSSGRFQILLLRRNPSNKKGS